MTEKVCRSKNVNEVTMATVCGNNDAVVLSNAVVDEYQVKKNRKFRRIRGFLKGEPKSKGGSVNANQQQQQQQPQQRQQQPQQQQQQQTQKQKGSTTPQPKRSQRKNANSRNQITTPTTSRNMSQKIAGLTQNSRTKSPAKKKVSKFPNYSPVDVPSFSNTDAVLVGNPTPNSPPATPHPPITTSTETLKPKPKSKAAYISATNPPPSSGSGRFQVVMLLIDPKTKRFELLQVKVNVFKTTVAEVLKFNNVIHEKELERVKFVGVCKPTSESFTTGQKLKEVVSGPEILIAMPSRMTAKQCVKMARPVLYNKHVVTLLKRNGINTSYTSSGTPSSMKQTQKQNLTKRPRHPEHVLTIQNTDDQIPSVVTNSSAVPTSHNGVVVVVQPDQVPSQVQSPPLDDDVTGDNEEKDCAEVTKAVVGDEQTPLGVENMGGNTNNTTKPEMENNDNETNTQYEVKSDSVEDEKKIESLETPKEMEEQQQPETDQDGETNANDAEHPVDDQQGSAIHQEDSFDSDDEFPLIIPEGEILERTEEQLEDYDEIFEENYEDIYPSTLISSANMPTDDDKAFEEYINRLLADQKIDFITSVIDDADPDPSNEPLIDDSENADLDEFVSAHEKVLSALIAS